MEPTLKVTIADMRCFIEWSFFVEEGNIHARAGESSVEKTEINLGNKLLTVYRNMKKNERSDHSIGQEDCEMLQYWYHKLPEIMVDQKDADLHAKISVFIAK